MRSRLVLPRAGSTGKLIKHRPSVTISATAGMDYAARRYYHIVHGMDACDCLFCMASSTR